MKRKRKETTMEFRHFVFLTEDKEVAEVTAEELNRLDEEHRGLVDWKPPQAPVIFTVEKKEDDPYYRICATATNDNAVPGILDFFERITQRECYNRVEWMLRQMVEKPVYSGFVRHKIRARKLAAAGVPRVVEPQPPWLEERNASA